MVPELQGRLPIRVELQGLKEDELFRILTEPEANLIEQHRSLLKAEGDARQCTCNYAFNLMTDTLIENLIRFFVFGLECN